jgi:hypothetical protein
MWPPLTVNCSAKPDCSFELKGRTSFDEIWYCSVDCVVYVKVKIKVKSTLKQAMKAQRESRDIDLLFL